jgi:outer membrane receptor for ferrienterochelin and colicin
MIAFEKPVRHRMAPGLFVTFNCCFFIITLCPFQASGQVAPGDLTSVSLEQLMNIEVTSVSKKQQKLQNAPAAIYVITQEDIRRSGATSLESTPIHGRSVLGDSTIDTTTKCSS